MSDHDDFGAFLIGFIVGGVSGAIAALLLAPQSGEETRIMIKDKAIELRDEASTSVEDAVQKANKAANDGIKRAEELLNDAKKRANEVTEEGQVVLDQSEEKTSKAASKATKS